MFSFLSPKKAPLPPVSDITVRELQKIVTRFIATYQLLEFQQPKVSFSDRASIICDSKRPEYTVSQAANDNLEIRNFIGEALDTDDDVRLIKIQEIVSEVIQFNILKIQHDQKNTNTTTVSPSKHKPRKFNETETTELRTLYRYFEDKYNRINENPTIKNALRKLTHFATDYAPRFTKETLNELNDFMKEILRIALPHLTPENNPNEIRNITHAFEAVLITSIPEAIEQTQSFHVFLKKHQNELHQILEIADSSTLMRLYFEKNIQSTIDSLNLDASEAPPIDIASTKETITFIITHINALSNQTFVVEDYNRLIFGTCEKISAIENDRGAFIKEKYEQLLTAPLEPARYKLYLLKPFDLWFQANAASEQKPYTIDKNGTFLFYAAGTPANERPVDEQINWRPKPQSSASSSSSSS